LKAGSVYYGMMFGGWADGVHSSMKAPTSKNWYELDVSLSENIPF